MNSTQTRGHQMADACEYDPYDTCRHCGQPVILRDGRLVTMLAGNAECYGRQS